MYLKCETYIVFAVVVHRNSNSNIICLDLHNSAAIFQDGQYFHCEQSPVWTAKLIYELFEENDNPAIPSFRNNIAQCPGQYRMP